MSGKHRSSHKSSSAPRGPSSKPPSTQQAEIAPTWPIPSFLFVVNELPINDDPDNGGTVPRTNENGRWVPPLYSAGFWAQRPGHVFRWVDGNITPADGYQWYNGDGWDPNNNMLLQHRVTTMFYCNRFTHYLTANGDASTRNIADSDFPNHRWWPLTFEHDGGLTRLNEGTEEQYLAGNGGGWVRQLGLEAYNNRDGPVSEGLAGNVASIVALIALSCRQGDLDTVLVHDRAWRGHRWRGHNRAHGRTEPRGVVATVYLDPENPQGSTYDTLAALEWEGGAILR